MQVALLAALLVTAATAAEPTWHLSLQLYSLPEHTTQADLTNNTPGLGPMRRINPSPIRPHEIRLPISLCVAAVALTAIIMPRYSLEELYA